MTLYDNLDCPVCRANLMDNGMALEGQELITYYCLECGCESKWQIVDQQLELINYIEFGKEKNGKIHDIIE